MDQFRETRRANQMELKKENQKERLRGLQTMDLRMELLKDDRMKILMVLMKDERKV